MKIALVGPTYPFRGGIAHYTTQLYRTLREQGHQATLVSFKRQYPQRLFPGQSDKDPSLEPLKTDDAQYWIDSLNPLTWLTSFWRIYRYRPDLVILQWWTSFLAPVWIVLGALHRVFSQRPLIIICHNVLPHEKRWWDMALARLVLSLGTGLIVQSEAEKERLLNLLPGDRRVAIVPLPVFDMFANECITQEEARRTLGLPVGTPILLFFGIVRDYKGLSDALEALPAIQAQLGNIMLVVAGEFWDDKQPYLDKIEQLGIGERVVIQDRYIPNEQVPLYFSAADALIAPYRHVTGSGAVQMARGFGLPVITTRIGALPEAVTDGETGLLVTPGDPEALASASVRYFRDNLQAAMRSRIKSAHDSADWSRLAVTLEKFANLRSQSEEKRSK